MHASDVNNCLITFKQLPHLKTHFCHGKQGVSFVKCITESNPRWDSDTYNEGDVTVGYSHRVITSRGAKSCCLL